MESGDPEGLVAFHAALGPWVLAAIEAIVGPGPAAEELLHRVFLSLWKEAPQYDRHFGRPALWALASARETAVASLDRERRGSLDGTLSIADEEHPLNRLAAQDRDALVAAWRGALPTPERGADGLRALASNE
jgi:DNA-directed RNA polymerase specialized sigma24 family protein